MPVLGETRKGIEIGYKDHNRLFVWHACAECGKERWVGLRWKQPISKRCLNCVLKLRRGVLSPVWTGGRRTRRDGYIEVLLQPDDFFYPMADKAHLVKEHRLIMAKSLNRCLLDWEIVHHKGTKYPMGSKEDKADNRLANLKLYPTSRQHLSTAPWRSAIAKRDKRITQLEARLTLLEAENVLLRSQILPNIRWTT